MSYRTLKMKVEVAEQQVELHLQRARDKTHTIGHTLKQSYTPTRLLLAGFVGGALIGWLRPLGRAGAVAGLLRMVTGLQPPLVAVASWLATLPRAPAADHDEAGGPPTQGPS